MISDHGTAIGDFGFRTPTEVHSPSSSSPLSLSPAAGTPSPTTPLQSHSNECQQIFNFEKLTVHSPQTSPVKLSASPIFPNVATVISPPHQQHQIQQQISRSRSLVSSSSSSLITSSSLYSHQSRVQNTFPSSTPSVFPQNQSPHSTQFIHCQRNQTVVDNQYTSGAFTCNDNSTVQQKRLCFTSNNNNSSSINSSSSDCSRRINLNASSIRFSHPHQQNCHELDLDLQEIQPFDFNNNINSTTTNNNNNNNNTCPMSSCNRIGDSGIGNTDNLMIGDHTPSSNLPPVHTLFSHRVLKEELFLPGAIMEGDEEQDLQQEGVGSRSSSCSSMEDDGAPQYTILTSVTEPFQEEPYFEPFLTQSPYELVKTEPCDSLYFDSYYSPGSMFEDSPSHDSEGYESSSAEYSGVIPQTHFQYQYLPRNASIPEAAPLLHRPIVEIPYDHPHPSPMSDEGFVDGTNITEENLPDFAKIQHLPAESDRQAARRRGSPSSPKEKKKVARDFQPVVEKERRKPGRKPGQVSNVLHLWEFMRDLLQSPDNPGIIEWISKSEGVFRVVNSTEVARLWGEKKKNKKKMTYEKLSRSLRYSRLEGYFADLPKDKNYPKKLCFKFGPKSKDWH